MRAARATCLAAAARIVAGTGAVSILDGVQNSDPMLGPVYAAAAGVYLTELSSRSAQQGNWSPREARELETRLGNLMSTMASLAAYSPLIEKCFIDMREAYSAMAG
ncbi:hypothetical protein GGX14DRAFT_432290, partial [Mycena pura]